MNQNDDFPPEYNLLQNHVHKIVSSFDGIQSPFTCPKQISEVSGDYIKKYYTNKNIVFFDDYTVDKIVEISIFAQEWKNKFTIADKCKSEFLDLSICKKIIKIINETSVNEYYKKTNKQKKKRTRKHRRE